MAELNLPKNITIAFPEGREKMMHFEIALRCDEGVFQWVTWVLGS
jgi:ubiquitin-conjugating enzyme E2 M